MLGLGVLCPSSSLAVGGRGGYGVSGSISESVFTQGFSKSSEVGEAAVRKGMGFRLLEVLSLTRSSGLPELRTCLLHLVSLSIALKSPPAL